MLSLTLRRLVTRMQLSQLQRREFITLLGGAAVVWPVAGWAQQERMRRIGVLMGYPEAQSEFASFVQELQKFGWAEGRNLRIDVRWGIPADPGSPIAPSTCIPANCRRAPAPHLNHSTLRLRNGREFSVWLLMQRRCLRGLGR
jgi:hypothetical protein